MDNLSDLLSNKKFDEPPEIELIKKFIKKRYQEEVEIKITQTQIIITANGAALASRLHSDIPDIQNVSKTDKSIIIFIR